MTPPKYRLLILLALAAASPSPAAEITGKVRDTSADMATVAIEGDALPSSGDSVEIFFKLAGGNEDILVASGKVAAVEAKVVKVKIENASGTVAKDQLARITSASVAKAPGQSPSPASSPSGTAATGSSIVGDWTSNGPGGTTASFSFKEDGSLLWVVEHAEWARSTRAKYRIDPSVQPQGIEFFDIEEGEEKGERPRGIFEVQSDGRFKIDFFTGLPVPASREFSKSAWVFSRATSPIVRPNKPAPPTPPTPPPHQAPPPAPDEALVTEATQAYDRGDDAAALAAAEKALAHNPKNARAFFGRGSVFLRKKDWTAAIADFEKAMELDPGMNLQDLIDKTKAARESADRLKPTPTPERSRAKTKRNP